jgi:PIN domain nuclease of toxin-antitoxin system
VKLLLDTHALIWWLLDDPALPKRVAGALRAPDNQIFVSSASAWEIATKFRLGRMPEAESLVHGFREILDQQRFSALAVTVEHAIAAGLLKADHADPFDRMLIAQARIEGLRLVTGDRVLKPLAPAVLW